MKPFAIRSREQIPVRARRRILEAAMPDLKTPYKLSTALAALMLVQSLLGLLFQEQYRDEEWIAAVWFGNDWVTLVVGVPLLVVALVFTARSSVRGLLLWLGMIGYAVYNYAYYLFGAAPKKLYRLGTVSGVSSRDHVAWAALNVFFPLYVVLLVLSGVTLLFVLSRVDIGHVAASFRPKTPVQIIGGYLVFVGIGLASAWIAMWALYVFAGRPLPVTPEAFRLVAALDISIMVTTLGLGGILLWQRKPWGYVVAAIAGIQSSLYLLVLSANSVIAIHRGLAETPGELPVWGTLAVLTTAVTLLLLVNVRSDRGPLAQHRICNQTA
jgi:hypothetical protein